MNSPLASYLKTLVVVVLVAGLFLLALKILVAVIPMLIGIGIVVVLGYAFYLLVRVSYAQHKHYLVHEKPFDDAMTKLHRLVLKEQWAELKKSWAKFRGKRATP